MKLKDFVAETLKEILDGVVEVQEHYEKHGGSVNANYQYKSDALLTSATQQPAQMVEFDVLVTTHEGTESKAGIGVFMAAVHAGAAGKSDHSTASSSRIRFSVPIILPSKPYVPKAGGYAVGGGRQGGYPVA